MIDDDNSLRHNNIWADHSDISREQKPQFWYISTAFRDLPRIYQVNCKNN